MDLEERTIYGEKTHKIVKTSFDSRLPNQNKLLPFQVDAVTKMLQFLNTAPVHGVYNACEPGLGKTIMTVTALKALNIKRTLIIAPSIVKLNWEEEILKWWGESPARARPTIIVVNSSHDLPLTRDNFDFTIISYALIRKKRIAEYLVHNNYQALVLDEAQSCKNSKTLTAKSIFSTLWPTIKYKICLSGTPFTQSIMDCYSLFSRLAPKQFNNFFTFAAQFTNIEETPWGRKYNGVKNADTLKKIIRKSFFVRYRKDEVLKELPPKRWTRILLPKEYLLKQSEEEAAAHAEYVKLLKASLSRGAGSYVSIPQPPKHFMEKRREQGELKIEPIVEFITPLLEAKVPVVLFAIHINFIEKVKNLFASYNPSVIVGALSSEERQEQIKRFQERTETDLIILQMQAGGVGITLTRSSTVVLGELSYSPADISQACDRVHRIGAKSAVNVYYFVVRGSLEEDIEDIVVNKASAFNEVLK